MKLSKLFHTLYATVMALPVLIIPIFALNILHKETEPISIEVQENKIVDFNQRIKNGNFENNNDWGFGNATTYSIDSNECTLTLRPSATTTYINVYQSNFFTAQIGHKYYFKYEYETSGITYTNVIYTNNTSYLGTASKLDNEGTYETILNADIEFIRMQFTFTNNAGISSNAYAKIKNIQCFDLTQMFGENKEPTIYEFNSYFTDEYYNFTLRQNKLVPNYSVIYNDTDIGSQFVYALYKPVNDYFNFGEFFGLSGMYDWFQLNIFNGTAPLSFFIVFNIMIYWLFISLFWLLFDILIYVPMVIHKWLDKAEM